MTVYQSFIQRFGELFRQEIECNDQEATIQVIVTLMNKCGIKELLDKVPIEEPRNNKIELPPKPAKKRNPVVHESPNSADSSLSNKKINGYNLFVRETMTESKRQKHKKTMTDVAQEWKALPKSEQNEYKDRARELNN